MWTLKACVFDIKEWSNIISFITKSFLLLMHGSNTYP